MEALIWSEFDKHDGQVKVYQMGAKRFLVVREFWNGTIRETIEGFETSREAIREAKCYAVK